MTSAIDDMKRDGVAFAMTREGYELPVLDIAHSRFAIREDAETIAALNREIERSERQRRRVPKFIWRLLLKSAAKKSRLARALFDPKGSFLDGMSTYVMKLGGDHLVPPHDTPMDRRFASSPHATFLRMRTQQTARLIADGLRAELSENDKRPLHIVNIAGGPAMDSINALMLLAVSSPELLNRPLTIHVLDMAEPGPYFGRNALHALQDRGRKLAGLDISFEHLAYDWNDTAVLRNLLGSLTGVVAACSEGGLFEYGNDEAIVANLSALKAANVKFVAGSVTRADEARQRLAEGSRVKLILRGIEVFRPLAERAGIGIAEVRSTVWSDQVLLRPF
ncbi:hypothetical protein [Flaviflagellibacter deserti]|uniref:Histidine-specific methyltransferase SAM-dependent domain-containing protein n=1 Tax=Flaviflagellibacter deserti TaxID=2267266 RepID=A0ABV9Z7A3_9HYPH